MLDDELQSGISEMFQEAPQTQLAMFHTFFYVIAVAFMLPLTGLLVNAVTKMIPEKSLEATGLSSKNVGLVW